MCLYYMSGVCVVCMCGVWLHVCCTCGMVCLQGVYVYISSMWCVSVCGVYVCVYIVCECVLCVGIICTVCV